MNIYESMDRYYTIKKMGYIEVQLKYYSLNKLKKNNVPYVTKSSPTRKLSYCI